MTSRLGTRISAIGIAVALLLTGCGSPNATTSSSGLEKPNLLIGVVPVPSSAPLFIAEKRGFFKQEGLTVKTEIIQAPQAVMPKILNGSMDAFLTSYVSLMSIRESGVKIKLFQHSQEALPGVAGVVVPKGSPVKEAKDLKGKTIAVNVLKALGQTVTNAHLEQAGLKPDDVKYVPVQFADQLAALSSGKVDAAWLVEPFLTAAQKQLGATQVIDTMDGPTAGVPIDGWGVSEEWLAKNPKTAAALHRALAKAQQIASQDRNAINEVIPTYTQIKAETATQMHLGKFSMDVDKASLQKLADLLVGYGYLKNKVDAGSLLATDIG